MPKEKSFNLTEFRKLLKSKLIVLGTERTMKNLKIGKIERVFLSSNCPRNIEEDMEYYASLSKAKVEKLQFPNDELGIICKKQFSISVLSLLKGEN